MKINKCFHIDLNLNYLEYIQYCKNKRITVDDDDTYHIDHESLNDLYFIDNNSYKFNTRFLG